MRSLPLISLLALLIVACGSEERSRYHNLGGVWMYGDTIAFDIADNTMHPVQDEKGKMSFAMDSDTVITGSVEIVVRHTNDYAYSNLWLELAYTDADSARTDTVNVHLADRYGNWYGSGIGVSYQHVAPVINDVALNVKDAVKVRHIMRVDTLEGIEQIGIVFIPATEKKKQ